MKIFRNFLKYTIGLPLIIIATLTIIPVGFALFLIGQLVTWNDLIEIIDDIWKPID